MRKEPSIQINSDSDKSENIRKSKRLKQSSILMAVLPLAACGGGGGGGAAAPSGNTPAPAPTPDPDPDFIENPTNVFIALDDSGRTLSEGGSSASLTVTGKAGSDSITTGSGADKIVGAAGNDTIISNGGNDLIRAGEGRDTVSAGSGNDAIVVVGTTTAGQYTNADITNSGGSGTDLSSLISLADLNGRTVSEVVSDESIDGGTGTNTLFIYGAVDLTGVTLNNVTVLIVNSNVTLTAEQMVLFTTVDGDGTSVINIEVPPGDTYIIDLSVLNITDIGSLNIDGDVTFIIDDENDLDGINAINTNSDDDVSVEINGNGGATTVNLGDIADTFENVDVIEVAEDVTLEVDNAADVTSLGLEVINGEGEIDTNGNSDVEQALEDNVAIAIIKAGDDNFSTPEDTPLTISIEDLISNDSSETAGDMFIHNISLSGNSVNNARIQVDYELGIVIVTPNQDYNGALSLNYTLTDAANNTAGGQINVNVSAVNDLPTAYGSTVAGDDVITHDGAIYIGDFLLSNDGERLLLDDPDSSNSTIYIRVESISGGTITRNGTPVTEFTYNDVINRLVEFNFTGGTPTLELSFSNNGTTYGNPTPVEVTVTDANSIYVLTQGGTFGTSETIEIAEKYLLEDADKLFYADNVDATFTNFGVIESYGVGYLTPLYMVNVDTVTNAGIIDVSASSDNAAAIYITQTGLVINSGLLKSHASTSGNDLATGVYAPDIANSGTIHVTGAHATGVVHNTGVNLDNSGIIFVSGENEARGIDAFYETSNIINSGKIIVEDNSDSFLSIGMEFNLSIATVTNSGTIQAEVAIDADYSLMLLNTGYIIGDLQLSIYSDEIDNFGEISGNIFLGASADWLNNVFGNITGIVYGEAGSDFLLGGAFDDYFSGGSDDDLLTTGNDGADILAGGINNDTIELQHYGFESVDGGSGDDTLVLSINSTSLNLNSFDTSKITNFEVIDLTGNAVTLTLDAQAVIDVSDGNNILRINGQADDILNSNSEWTRGDDQVINSVTYRSYTSNEATLLVEVGITFNGTILNDVPSISIGDVATNEAAETATFTVTLSIVSDETITVDYLAPDSSSGTLIFNPGETEKTFTTSWLDDDLYESAEISFATLSNPTNATLLDDTGQLTINNDEPVSIASINDVVANEAEETATFTVSLDQESGIAVTVDYTAPDGSSGTLTFNPGETEKTFDTAWNDDDIEEANEIGWATIGNNSLGVAIGDPAGQLTIVDDDVSGPSITINDIVTNEAAQTASYIVSLSETSSETITVDYNAPDGTSGTLTFKPGETHQTFKTTWIDDANIESDEVVNATLSTPSNANIADGTGQLTIVDDDKVYTITIGDLTLNEATEKATFTLTLSEAATTTVRVEYDTSDGKSGLIAFYPGETEKIFNYVWTDDEIVEADDVITVTLSNPENATIADDTAILTIEDNDDTPNITINWIQTDEADEIDTFTVSLSEAGSQVITVDYLAPDGSSGTLTFNPGETEKTFNTSWSDDALAEDAEIVYGTLSNPTNATISDDSGRLVILNDDPGNRAPNATDINALITENMPYSVDVMPTSNDSDGDELTLINVSITPGEGTASIVDGEVHYDPGVIYDYLGSGEAVLVVVDYTITDGSLTDDGTVTFRVQGLNDAPIAIDDIAQTPIDQSVTIDVLDNDADAENDVLTITNATIASGDGTVSIVSGELVYDPNGDYDHLNPGESAEITLNYTISDGHYNGTGEVTVTVENDTLPASSINKLSSNESNEIDLTGFGDDSIDVTLSDVFDLTYGDNILTILGNTGDSVTSTGEGWTQGTDQTLNSETYNTYTAGGATLLIDDDIIQDIS